MKSVECRRERYEEEGEENDEDEDQDRDYASGMRWRFPRESEVDQLKEWAALLRCTSSTLVELTLENRYLCSGSFDDEIENGIDPGVTHPAEWGAFSIRESQKILFPVLSEKWPKLKQLKLVGMGEVEAVNQAVRHLEPRVQIEHSKAGIEIMAGDATPEQISTPREFYD